MFLSLGTIFATITDFNRYSDSFFNNPYTLIVETIVSIIFGGFYLGELVFRFFRFIKNKFVQ